MPVAQRRPQCLLECCPRHTDSLPHLWLEGVAGREEGPQVFVLGREVEPSRVPFLLKSQSGRRVDLGEDVSSSIPALLIPQRSEPHWSCPGRS